MGPFLSYLVLVYQSINIAQQRRWAKGTLHPIQLSLLGLSDIQSMTSLFHRGTITFSFRLRPCLSIKMIPKVAYNNTKQLSSPVVLWLLLLFTSSVPRQMEQSSSRQGGAVKLPAVTPSSGWLSGPRLLFPLPVLIQGEEPFLGLKA